nr:uncharacterized protein LOC107447986 isoform X2 [Parasteatoda tepidariorum]
METTVEKEFSALGGLFQHILSDLKNSAPVWDDFLLKAIKFQGQLKSTILASTSFLDAFQKIADMATNTRGATKEIGSALTRLCLRQRSVEAKLKIFSNTMQDGLINPLQEKIEEWKKNNYNLDKEHSKEFKRAKQELKKKSSDTLRLQKKVRKVGVIDIRRTLDSALQDVTDKYLLLEEIEKQSVKKALIEERSRFCLFVGYLQPVLESELVMLNETNHIEEIIDTLSKITVDPHLLPSSSEQVILDAKKSENTWSFHVTPPGSPGSLGSRKSSFCSISSINSSSSGSLKSHSSRKLSHSHVQTLGRKHLNSVASQDSGFTSQDTLYVNNPSVPVEHSSQLSTFHESETVTFSTPSSPVPPVTSTWPNLNDSESPEKEQNSALTKYHRPHTISSAYEKSNHSRPALTVHTFLPLDQDSDFRSNYGTVGTFKSFGNKFKDRNCASQPGTPIYSKPSLPERSYDTYKARPCVPEKSASVKAKHEKHYSEINKSLPDFNMIPADQVVPHPIYANTGDPTGRNSSREEKRLSKAETKNDQRKNFAAVLNEGLLMQSKWSRAEKSCFSEDETAPTVPRHSRLNGGNSETLPRSRGMSPAFIPPRKANTLQRVGSAAGFKPPTPVRRSSSITSTSCHGTVFEGSLKKNDSSQSLSSGAGEVRYSPSLRELKKSHSTLSSPIEKYGSLRHVEINPSPERNSVCSTPSRDSSLSSDSSIVTDVSDSRARLIQDLNSALTQQPKPLLKKPQQDAAPIVPPRNTSKNEDRRNIFSKHDTTTASENLYSQITKKEKSAHTFNAKPMLSQNIHKQSNTKPRLKDCLSQGDLTRCSREWVRSTEEKNSNGHISDNEIILKKSFVAALNARLAEHQKLSGLESQDDDKPHIAPWLKNDKIIHSWNSSFRRLAPQITRESLMDQIKRGKRLRRVTCNDRSSPKFS